MQRDIPYNPTVKDGRTTKGLAIDKTNWAMPLEKPPYEAYCTTCGVTFTFGGVRIDTDGRVLDTAQKPIPGLYAAGELVGGLVLPQLSRAAPGWCRARCSARSPAPPPDATAGATRSADGGRCCDGRCSRRAPPSCCPPHSADPPAGKRCRR